MAAKKDFFETALQWITKRSIVSVQTESDGYEPPKAYTNKQTGEEIRPDFSFLTHGSSKSFTEIALKSESPRNLVTRWKLLSLMASMNRGKLHLLTPRGHKQFTQKLVETHNINALIHSI